MVYIPIKRFQLFEKYFGDFDFFEFYNKDLVDRALRKHLFPQLFNSIVFVGSNAFFRKLNEYDNGTYIAKDLFTYGFYYLKDIEYDKFEFIDFETFLSKFDDYKNEMKNSLVPLIEKRLLNVNISVDNTRKFIIENLSENTEFVDIFQFLYPDTKKCEWLAGRWEYFKCFIGFDWNMKRIYRIEIYSD